VKTGSRPQYIRMVIWLPDQNQNHCPTSRVVLLDIMGQKKKMQAFLKHLWLLRTSEHAGPHFAGPHPSTEGSTLLSCVGHHSAGLASSLCQEAGDGAGTLALCLLPLHDRLHRWLKSPQAPHSNLHPSNCFTCSSNNRSLAI